MHVNALLTIKECINVRKLMIQDNRVGVHHDDALASFGLQKLVCEPDLLPVWFYLRRVIEEVVKAVTAVTAPLSVEHNKILQRAKVLPVVVLQNADQIAGQLRIVGWWYCCQHMPYL